ncbi:unnamed protein product, partial [Enterobius vermicularis]|uniref:Ac45-VOA1_TM domain-containing protein n=1 Tax=Enterobius vermicularis TaxID=51028 RepID=A0A0N4V4W1_ENTVE
DFRLVFTRKTNGYWGLSSISLLSELAITKGVNGALLTESWNGYGYACSQTPAGFFQMNNKDYSVGIGFINMEIDLDASSHEGSLRFNRNVSDCIGTFSVGSWMGIVCSLVLASILMFGYLMLQSVQTMDRFDDPKQKQIVINFKE